MPIDFLLITYHATPRDLCEHGDLSSISIAASEESQDLESPAPRGFNVDSAVRRRQVVEVECYRTGRGSRFRGG